MGVTLDAGKKYYLTNVVAFCGDDELLCHCRMIGNYFRSTFRLFGKERLYVFINTVGLAVGMATCFLIYVWVSGELSYDTFYPDYERIYRVITRWDDTREPGFATAYPMVRSRVLPQFPEVESSARIFDQGFLGSKTKIASADKVITDLRFFYGDSTVLELFGLPMLSGDASTALSRPNSVVLSETTAKKFFGTTDALGKTLRIGTDRDMEVTGVVRDMPANAHFHFDLMASMSSHPWIKNAENSLWSGIVFHTYVKLRAGSDPIALESKMASLLDNFPDDPNHVGQGLDLRLQRVTDIHQTSHHKFEFEQNGNSTYVLLFVTIAALVLIVAIVNYVNLATARHTQRYKEVGVRKALGAARRQLITQFTVESLVIAMFAFLLASLLSETVRPLLQTLSGQEVYSISFIQPRIVLGGLLIAGIIGVATGILPALALSSFQPARLFRPAAGSARGFTLRKALIVSQFTVSILLTLCTAITYRQVNYLKNAQLGYSTDHVLVLDISLPGAHENVSALKSEMGRIPGVIGATAVSQLPTDIQTGENIDVSPSQTHGVYSVSVDQDFFRVMGITLAEGSDRVIALQPNDSMNHFVLNRSALKAIGWRDGEAVGREISIRHGNQKPGPILGVAEDFHFQSLHHAIGPLAIEFNPGSFQYLLVKVKAEDVAVTIAAVEESWKRLAGGIPFDYQFLDEQYNKLYRAERQSGSLFVVFAIIAVFISLLGLFGLASFSMERRTKEMGLRKILGADVWRISALVSKEFLFLILVAFGMAVPLGYLFASNWMAQFAFRANAGAGLFLACGLLNLMLALLTLLYHTVKISRTDPVKTLRYE